MMTTEQQRLANGLQIHVRVTFFFLLIVLGAHHRIFPAEDVPPIRQFCLLG